MCNHSCTLDWQHMQHSVTAVLLTREGLQQVGNTTHIQNHPRRPPVYAWAGELARDGHTKVRTCTPSCHTGRHSGTAPLLLQSEDGSSFGDNCRRSGLAAGCPLVPQCLKDEARKHHPASQPALLCGHLAAWRQQAGRGVSGGQVQASRQADEFHMYRA